MDDADLKLKNEELLMEGETTDKINESSWGSNRCLTFMLVATAVIEMYLSHRSLMAIFPEGFDKGEAYLSAALMTLLSIAGTYVLSNISNGNPGVIIEGTIYDDGDNDDPDNDNPDNDYGTLIDELKEEQNIQFTEICFTEE